MENNKNIVAMVISPAKDAHLRKGKGYSLSEIKEAGKTVELLRDLNMDIDILVGPIVREKDGLAMSSRNEYLSDQERPDALALYQSLNKAKEMINTGERNAKIIENEIKSRSENINNHENNKKSESISKSSANEKRNIIFDYYKITDIPKALKAPFKFEIIFSVRVIQPYSSQYENISIPITSGPFKFLMVFLLTVVLSHSTPIPRINMSSQLMFLMVFSVIVLYMPATYMPLPHALMFSMMFPLILLNEDPSLP